MKLTPIKPNPENYPNPLRPFLMEATVYDSSSSPDATVLLIDRSNGWFLKTAPQGSLYQECMMTRWFHEKGLAANVLEYISANGKDYLLTERIAGNDCTSEVYINHPERLCDTLAELLVHLHSLDGKGCPVTEHTTRYLQTVDRNYNAKQFDLSYLTDRDSVHTPDEVYVFIQQKRHLLQCDTVLHGDYCLPNIILQNWHFSGFVDVGNGGIGDRHVDLYWGAWTLNYNLHTDRYRQRFYDAYGRDRVDEERIRLIGACEVFG